MIWHGMVWYVVVWCGMVWYGMAWNGVSWHGMVWYGLSISKILRAMSAGGYSPWLDWPRGLQVGGWVVC